MSHLINNQQKMNDVIFADRNKAYGAYALRSSYGNTVLKSLSFMILGVSSVLSVAFYLSNKNNKEPDMAGQVFVHDSIYVIPFKAKEEEEPKQPEQKQEESTPPESKTTSSSASVTVVDNTTVEKTDSIQNSSVTNNTVTNTDVISIPTGKGTGSSVVTNSSSGSPLGGIKTTIEVDSEPVFEGGLSALYRFVGSHLRYPEPALDAGKEGTVYVKFVVDETGKVGNLSLLNNSGYGMDDEALRVVALIPKFKSPAKIKGEAVKVYYQLPIRFRYK